jgi:hypothetical protein
MHFFVSFHEYSDNFSSEFTTSNQQKKTPKKQKSEEKRLARWRSSPNQVHQLLFFM